MTHLNKILVRNIQKQHPNCINVVPQESFNNEEENPTPSSSRADLKLVKTKTLVNINTSTPNDISESVIEVTTEQSERESKGIHDGRRADTGEQLLTQVSKQPLTSAVTQCDREGDTNSDGRRTDKARTTHSLLRTSTHPPSDDRTTDDLTILTEDVQKGIINELKSQKQTAIAENFETTGLPGKKKIRTQIKNDIFEILNNVNNNQVKPMPVLTVEGTILSNINKKIQIILDSGCNQNLIREDLVQGKQFKPITKLKLIAANNQPVRILGEINLTIKIGTLEITDKFLVTPILTNDAIAGNLFLFRNNMLLDYKNSQITITKHNDTQIIPMQEGWKELINNYRTNSLVQTDIITDIRLPEDIIIAPHQHRKILDIPDNGKDLLFETDKNFRKTKKCHAYIHESLIENQEKIKQISIFNASDTTKRIKAGTLIGITVSPDDQIDDKSSKQEENKKQPKNKDPKKEQLTDKDGIPFDISDHLSAEEHNGLVKLLKQYKHMFTSKTEDLQAAKVKPVILQVKDQATPTNCIPYKQGHEERKILNQMLQQLHKSDIIEIPPDMTENSSPVFLTKNKDNSYRLITDLRKVNQIIKTDVTPIPNINLILTSLNKANTFTRLDMKSAYHQIPIAEESRYLLTIKSQDYLFRYKRMPFGLACATSIFTKIIRSILQEQLYSSCLNYIDDLICYQKDYQSELESIRQVLEKLDKYNFKLNTKKCKFMYPTTNILGHRISKEGITAMPETVAAVKSYKVPTTIKQLRGWLGISNYFRRYIKVYARIMYPITELIKEYNREGKFTWSSECNQAFNQIKQILTTAPLLRHWDENLDNVLIVDASLIGLGACLAQKKSRHRKITPNFLHVQKILKFTNELEFCRT